MKTLVRTFAGLAMALIASGVGAAELENLRRTPDVLERIEALGENAPDSAVRAALGLSGNETLEVLRTYDDGRGGTVTRYRQTFRGVPVWGEQIVIGRDASGVANGLNGRVVRGLAAELTQLRPALSDAAALAAMKERAGLEFGGSGEAIYSNEKSELVIYVNDATARLSYAVSFFADSEMGGHPTRPTFIVDALSGEVLFEFDGLTHADCSTCLSDGVPETGLAGSRRQWQFFTFEVPGSVSASDLLEVSISGGTGDADLYVRFDANPTTNAYDCRPYVNGNNEECTLAAKAGIWHIGLYAYRNYSGVSLVARVKSLSPAQGSGPGGNSKTGEHAYNGTPKPPSSYDFLSVVSDGSACTMSNANVKTVDLNHGTSGSTAYSYGDGSVCFNDSDAINGAYSPLNDAHYFGGVVYDMYQAYMGLAPLTFQLTMRVHYSNNYENAFWDGSAMTFGDGASTFYPLVSLDVSAHEVSHGFTEQNSNLTYSGESGGINEAFSDIAGEAAEFFMRGTNDFLVGWEIFKSQNGALRYMCNPRQDGRSIDNVADYYGGLDVHYSSGIFNRAFCELAKTTGWDTAEAFQAFARANQLYWTNSTGFVDGAQGVVDAASDLGFPPQEVADAFAVVGITGLNVPGATSNPNPPEAPGNLSATAVSDSQIDLAWTDVANEDGYEIWRSTDNVTFIRIDSVSVDVTTYPDSLLAADKTYYYQIRAFNAGGSSDPSITAWATTAPPPVISLSATGYKIKGVKYADLIWSWSGATGSVDVYRDGINITTDIMTDGSGGTDGPLGKGSGTATYQVCEAGTSTCSNQVTVVW